MRANGLAIVDELMTSSTRLYASRAAFENPTKRAEIERLKMLLQSVLTARTRVLIELNVYAERLEAVIEALPAMRAPTVASLHHAAGFAVKAAVPRSSLTELIPRLKEMGASDLLVSTPEQIVP